jgi:hypothetical protein
VPCEIRVVKYAFLVTCMFEYQECEDQHYYGRASFHAVHEKEFHGEVWSRWIGDLVEVLTLLSHYKSKRVGWR